MAARAFALRRNRPALAAIARPSQALSRLDGPVDAAGHRIGVDSSGARTVATRFSLRLACTGRRRATSLLVPYRWMHDVITGGRSDGEEREFSELLAELPSELLSELLARDPVPLCGADRLTRESPWPGRGKGDELNWGLVGKYWRAAELRALRRSEGGDVSGRHSRTPWSLPVFASFVSVAFVLAAIAPPAGTSVAAPVAVPGQTGAGVQSLTATGAHSNTTARDGFTVTKIEPPNPVAPAVGEPDPGSAQAIALQMLSARGFGSDQFDCLVALWNRESRWNVYAQNPSSGAYGIPQALPGDKMASAGADWATNPVTQIAWGLGYIEARYGNPCGAWGHSEEKNWY